jgi:hypothetical protein
MSCPCIDPGADIPDDEELFDAVVDPAEEDEEEGEGIIGFAPYWDDIDDDEGDDDD